MVGLKEYSKQPKTKIKWYILNSDRGYMELDSGMPEGHSGKLIHQFAVPGVPPAPLAIPAGFEAAVTRVAWNFTAPPVAVPNVYVLTDGANIVSVYAINLLANTDNMPHERGNGSAVIGKATGNLTVLALLGVDYPQGEVIVEYYLVPLV